MSQTTIQISKDTREKLKIIGRKGQTYDEIIENESFSELLDRLIKSQSKEDLLKSLRGSIEFEDKEKFLKEIEKKRWEKRN